MRLFKRLIRILEALSVSIVVLFFTFVIFMVFAWCVF